MKETHAAGMKEFFFAVIWTVILFLLCGAISYAIPLYKIIGGIFTVILIVAFAYFVITRYSSVFTYTLTGGTLKINRQIGRRRNKTIEINVGKIQTITKAAPKLRPAYIMKQYILKNKRDCYIVFKQLGKEECLLFTPSDEMIKKIKKAVKKDGNNK